VKYLIALLLVTTTAIAGEAVKEMAMPTDVGEVVLTLEP